MLHEIAEKSDQVFFFYMSIPLEETLMRHKTKPNAHEFGEKEIRKWYIQHDTISSSDIVIGPDLSQDQSIDLILRHTEI